MDLRIEGFSDRGEARIVNERGELVGYGNLRINTIGAPDVGDIFDVDVTITWIKEPAFDWETF